MKWNTGRKRWIACVIALLFALLAVGCQNGEGDISDEQDKVLSAISITSPPDKTEYTAGEYFSTAGMRVEAAFIWEETEITEDVTEEISVSAAPLVSGQTSVEILYLYGGITKRAEQPVRVDAVRYPQVEVPSSALALASGEAESYWSVAYTSADIRITVAVADGTLFTDGDAFGQMDGISVDMFRTETIQDTLPDGVIRVEVPAVGDAVTRIRKNGAFVRGTEIGISVSSRLIEIGGKTGYEASVQVPYAALGITRTGTVNDANLTICPSLTDASSASEIKTAVYDGYGLDPNRANTFIEVMADNVFVANSRYNSGENFGTVLGTSLAAQGPWDFSKDNGSEPSIALGSTVGESNTAFLYGSSSTRLYAEMSVNISGMLNTGKNGRFGLTIQNKDREGFYIFVGMANNPAALRTDVGYGERRGDADKSNWDGLVKTAAVDPVEFNTQFTGEEYLSFAVLRDGGRFAFYIDDILVYQADNTAVLEDEPAWVGVETVYAIATVKDYELIDGNTDETAWEEQKERLDALNEWGYIDGTELTVRNSWTVSDTGVLEMLDPPELAKTHSNIYFKHSLAEGDRANVSLQAVRAARDGANLFGITITNGSVSYLFYVTTGATVPDAAMGGVGMTLAKSKSTTPNVSDASWETQTGVRPALSSAEVYQNGNWLDFSVFRGENGQIKIVYDKNKEVSFTESAFASGELYIGIQSFSVILRAADYSLIKGAAELY